MQNFNSYSLSALKTYCSDNGIHVTGDKRRKDSYIFSIEQHNRHNQTLDTIPAPVNYFVDTEEHLPVQRVDYFINLDSSTEEVPLPVATKSNAAIPAVILLLPILCLLLAIELALQLLKPAIPAIRNAIGAIPRLSLPPIPSRLRWQT